MEASKKVEDGIHETLSYKDFPYTYMNMTHTEGMNQEGRNPVVG